MAVAYKKKIGFKGTFLIEPKPKEPTKHQYDFDAATVLSFLRAYGLFDEFKLNIEANHATLAGHTFEHELTVASAAGRLGSIDANTGDLLLGWDTDQFPTSVQERDAGHARDPQAGRARPRRRQLRRQGAPWLVRHRGSLPRPRRGHGHLRPRRCSSPTRSSRTRPSTGVVAERYAGWKGDMGARSPARPVVPRRSRAVADADRASPSSGAGGRRCSRTSSTPTSTSSPSRRSERPEAAAGGGTMCCPLAAAFFVSPSLAGEKMQARLMGDNEQMAGDFLTSLSLDELTERLESRTRAVFVRKWLYGGSPLPEVAARRRLSGRASRSPGRGCATEAPLAALAPGAARRVDGRHREARRGRLAKRWWRR